MLSEACISYIMLSITMWKGLCMFSFHLFWTRTTSGVCGRTGLRYTGGRSPRSCLFFLHLSSAVFALLYIVRRARLSLSLLHTSSKLNHVLSREISLSTVGKKRKIKTQFAPLHRRSSSRPSRQEVFEIIHSANGAPRAYYVDSNL